MLKIKEETPNKINTNTNALNQSKNEEDIYDINPHRRPTSELTGIMTERLLDPSIVERYGTSLKMSMGREYKEYLNQRYEKLKKEFEAIDKNHDEHIQFDELYDFFSNYKEKTNVEISKEYLEDLFDFMDQDMNREITM